MSRGQGAPTRHTTGCRLDSRGRTRRCREAVKFGRSSRFTPLLIQNSLWRARPGRPVLAAVDHCQWAAAFSCETARPHAWLTPEHVGRGAVMRSAFELASA